LRLVENTLIIIGGPTASGKTSLAIEVAKYFNTEIVSADSRQLFREMNIGTAKPSQQQLAEVKHHFINSHSIHDEMNTGIYETQCISLLENLFKKNKTIVMVGGTGLYINAVVNGIDNLPEANTAIRNQLQQQLKLNGIESLQNKLKEIDISTYLKIDLQNPNRLMRALEVFMITGKPYSSFLKNKKTERNFDVKMFGIERSRERLYEVINKRVDDMIQNGLLKEAEQLYPFKNLNALQTVGYTELFDVIEKKMILEVAVEKIKQHTRNYAKRQVTWFKKAESIKWVTEVAEIISEINN
jgi:tRNA dimethylallyltransferase